MTQWLIHPRYALPDGLRLDIHSFSLFQVGHPKFHILRAVCDVLEGYGRVNEAIGCFLRMKSEQAEDIRKVCMINKYQSLYHTES